MNRQTAQTRRQSRLMATCRKNSVRSQSQSIESEGTKGWCGGSVVELSASVVELSASVVVVTSVSLAAVVVAATAVMAGVGVVVTVSEMVVVTALISGVVVVVTLSGVVVVLGGVVVVVVWARPVLARERMTASRSVVMVVVRWVVMPLVWCVD